MKNEIILRGSLAFTLLILIIMTFGFFEKDRVYEELKLSSSIQIDSLKEELEVQQLITDYYDRVLIKLSEQHPKDVEIVKHETE
jgi:hypothetical protein